MSKKTGISVKYVINQQEFDRKIAYKSQTNRTPSIEKPFSKELYEKGKKAYFDEYFYGISLENQNLEKIGSFDDPRNTVQFQKGYQRGMQIVSFNDDKMIPEEYRNSMINKHR
ncbi:MAG: hypothetical protein ACI4VL_06980 [Bacilli bacterium]